MIKSFEHIRHIFFLGIGGIGMSALARYFMLKGIHVSGYDKTPSELTDELKTEGANIHFADDPSMIPSGVDLVVYTPAIPADLKEFVHLQNSGIQVLKRSKVTGLITQNKITVAIAGTHGKTSISTLVAHILKNAGYPVTALIGGISRNYGTNFITSGKEEIMVVEADEYDRSFLELEPDIAVISAMDPDHLDIYGSTDQMLRSFNDFATQVKSSGTIIVRSDLEMSLHQDIQVTTFSVMGVSDILAINLRYEHSYQKFDIMSQGKLNKDIRLAIPGRHNVENASAAWAVCQTIGLSEEQIKQGIGTFTGVRRRFDFRIRQNDLVYIDDYAHHPRELHAFITAVREIYPGRKLTGLFQPHLYTRTRDFAEGFAESLDLLDTAWLLDIYPARELPIPGVTSALILEHMKNPGKELISRQDVLDKLSSEKPEIFLTMGAGDIDQMVEPIEKILKS
jgi:UDP-N-acetylmuramate--alanine ligase